MLSWGLFVLASVVTALDVSKVQNLISFGNSLTDEGRLIYYVSNNWTMPPAGTYLVNALYEAGLGYEAVVRGRWPGASVVLFDVHRLLVDVYENPREYLAEPYNVTGPWETCVAALTDCTSSEEDLAGYMWYDELHITAAVGESIFSPLFCLLGASANSPPRGNYR